MESISKDWWKSAEEEVQMNLKVKAARERLFDEKADRIKKKFQDDKKRRNETQSEPIRLYKMRSTSYWSEILGFPPETISSWCRDGRIRAIPIRGQWRISESSMMEFIEQERKRHVSKN